MRATHVDADGVDEQVEQEGAQLEADARAVERKVHLPRREDDVLLRVAQPELRDAGAGRGEAVGERGEHLLGGVGDDVHRHYRLVEEVRRALVQLAHHHDLRDAEVAHPLLGHRCTSMLEGEAVVVLAGDVAKLAEYTHCRRQLRHEVLILSAAEVEEEVRRAVQLEKQRQHRAVAAPEGEKLRMTNLANELRKEKQRALRELGCLKADHERAKSYPLHFSVLLLRDFNLADNPKQKFSYLSPAETTNSTSSNIYIYIYTWEDGSEIVTGSMEEPDLRVYHGNG